mmetsp:Transcript_1946/g.3557  ORF Transcript_1946/g.3557 Transcript_1946/m.3557 type:complete len:273 (+) Transcript_1946:555-1373(+)
MACTRLPNSSATLPCQPRGLLRFSSASCLLSTKYFARTGVPARHCRVEFIKQVLPRFRSPTAPALMGFPSWLDRPWCAISRRARVDTYLPAVWVPSGANLSEPFCIHSSHLVDQPSKWTSNVSCLTARITDWYHLFIVSLASIWSCTFKLRQSVRVRSSDCLTAARAHCPLLFAVSTITPHPAERSRASTVSCICVLLRSSHCTPSPSCWIHTRWEGIGEATTGALSGSDESSEGSLLSGELTTFSVSTPAAVFCRLLALLPGSAVEPPTPS